MTRMTGIHLLTACLILYARKRAFYKFSFSSITSITNTTNYLIINNLRCDRSVIEGVIEVIEETNIVAYGAQISMYCISLYNKKPMQRYKIITKFQRFSPEISQNSYNFLVISHKIPVYSHSVLDIKVQSDRYIGSPRVRETCSLQSL